MGVADAPDLAVDGAKWQARGTSRTVSGSGAGGAITLPVAGFRLSRDAACVRSTTGRAGAQWLHCHFAEHVMPLLRELFSTPMGLMSAAGIAFMLGMAVFFVRFFMRHMREDEAREKATRR